MRLNLGCGGQKYPGWINVDKYPTCGPDQVVDLEQFPWPWPDNSADEVRLYHVLEHLGAQTAVYLEIIKELYRVCRPNAKVEIIVPHPRHDDFLGDPTHVRPITEGSIRLLSQAANRDWLARGCSNTPLALYLAVDFEIEAQAHDLAEPWDRASEQKTISEADLKHAMQSFNNVIKQSGFILRARKPDERAGAERSDAVQGLEAPLVPGQPVSADAKVEALSTT